MENMRLMHGESINIRVGLLIVSMDHIFIVLQIRYSLVVIFKLNSVPGVQYKDVMMIDDRKY